MEHLTPLRRLADTLIDGGLDTFVTERRARGVSWRLIARELRERTGGSVDVTEATLRGWFSESTAVAS